MTVLARVAEVSRRYGDVLALDRVSLDIRAGELVGLLGPNGAGKSTLINLFVGLRRPTSGTVELLGGSPQDPLVRQGIGVTPQETGLPEALRVGEIVDFVSAHYPRRADKGDLLERFGLQDLVKRQIGGLSGGQRRRLAVALAFAGEPRMVFLDEPTTGLDVEARRALWDGVRSFHEQGGTILLTSHYLEEIEALAQRVVVVGHGRVLADDTVTAIRDVVGTRRVSLNAAELPELPGVLSSEREDGRVHLLTADPDRLVVELVRSGVPFSGLEKVRYNDVSPEVYRSFGFPGAEDLGNMWQFKRDFELYYCGARSLSVSRELNPDLQTFDTWLAHNKYRIPLA